MMKLLLLVFCIKVVLSDSFYDLVNEEWSLFKVEYNKTYGGTIEESYRFKIFIQNLKKIYQHNQKFELGTTSYKMGVNQFTDMFEDEVLETFCGINGTALSLNKKSGVTFIPPANVNIPSNFDWIQLGAVTKVKNQGRCGSCWAFSSTGALEGQNFRHINRLISLSEQNLIDCSGKYGNHGCKGGFMTNSFQYIKENNGIDTEESYPYEAVDNRQCRYNPNNKGASDRGYVNLPPRNEGYLQNAVATIGPISVAIQVTSSFLSYKEGIYYDPFCSSSPNVVNHGVLIVGYGTDARTGRDYWLVKNSWGETWGDNGYIKMIRNVRNNCNIATFGSYPLI